MSKKSLGGHIARQVALCPSRRSLPFLTLAFGGMLVAGPASAGGVLVVTGSRYVGSAQTLAVGQALPNSNGATAIADGSYPGVFTNDRVDGNFGVTAPIEVTTYSVLSHSDTVVPLRKLLNVTAASGISTSFSSKSELAVHLSTDGTALTLMGYAARPNILDGRVHDVRNATLGLISQRRDMY